MKNIDWRTNGSDRLLNGIHIAEVVDNNDPKAMERVLVRVVGIHNLDNRRY